MLVIGFVMVGLAWWLGVTAAQGAILALSLGLVLALELVNTAGEMLVDILSPDHDLRYGLVKDILAGGVLVASLAAGVVGAIIFWPRLF